MSASSVSVILPVHNQADHITDLVHDYQTALAKIPAAAELILVSNACRDSSPDVCARLANGCAAIKHIDTKDGGWGRAVKLGLQAAKGDILCYTNSARTSSEILTLVLLYAIAHPQVVVKANRKIRDSLSRRLGSLIYNLECRAFFDLPTWDINGTPKVFPRCFSRLLNLERDDDLIDAEFNAICRQESYPVIEVPVLSTRRHSGKSTTNIQSAVKMYWGAYKLWQKMRQPESP